MAKGPRTVRFPVSSSVVLRSPLSIGGGQGREDGEASSYFTLDGGSAPAAGVQVVGHSVSLTNDVHGVVISGLRFGGAARNWVSRTGAPAPCRGCPESTGGGIDLRGARRVVITDCSIRWASDEALSAGAVLDARGRPQRRAAGML
jgi:hypothetical protein